MKISKLARLTLALGLFAGLGTAASPQPAAAQQSFQRISGEGSSWAGNFIDAMRVNVAGSYGMTVDYSQTGSTAGRASFLKGRVDFAASDIPFQVHPEDASAPEIPGAGTYAYMPIVAGGTAFMYNLKINGQQVTNLRLSGENVAKIFTGVITMWNDPAIQADNPGLVMPARPIVPVVRSDGSGSSAQFTMWMVNRHPQVWQDYCAVVGRQNACGFTSLYPASGAMQAKSGDANVAGYIAQGSSEGAIGYVNYSYALGVQFPVAKILNAAGYYTEPTPLNVAVSLVQADVETQNNDPAVYLTQKLEGVYTNTDPRNYELSAYSYFILPTTLQGQVNEAKGYTLAEFSKYMMCQGQQQSAALGYSPMPKNLVERSFEQIAKIPGADVDNINLQECNNPTFTADGHNALVDQAPMPVECDRQGGPTQCANGTGGLPNQPTPVVVVVPGGGQPTPTPGQGSPSGQTTTTLAAGEGPAGGEQRTATGDADSSGGEQGSTNSNGDPAASSSTGNQTQTGSNGAAVTAAPCAPVVTTTTTTVPPTASSVPAEATTTTSTTTTTTTSTSVPGGSTTTSTTLVPCNSTTTTLATGIPGAVGAGSTLPPLQQGCDPDTGVCATGAAGQAFAPPVGAVTTTTLEQRSRWGSSQTLIALVSVLTLSAVFAPAWAWRHFSPRPKSV